MYVNCGLEMVGLGDGDDIGEEDETQEDAAPS